MKTDPRFLDNNSRVQNRTDLETLIETETIKQTTKEWLSIFEGSGLPYAAVNDIQGTMNHEHGKLAILPYPCSLLQMGLRWLMCYTYLFGSSCTEHGTKNRPSLLWSYRSHRPSCEVLICGSKYSQTTAVTRGAYGRGTW